MASAHNLKNTVQFYIERDGLANQKTDHHVANAYRIFNRLCAVADKKGRSILQLKVIEGDREPWAIALEDGYVILTRGAIATAYRGVTEQAGEARLAFLLGHELAHLAKNDFWHREVHRALEGEPSAEGIRAVIESRGDLAGVSDSRRLAAIREKETQADDLGFLYAGIAGYRVDLLLSGRESEGEDFFRQWMEQTQSQVDRSHPDPDDRAALLRARLKQLNRLVEFFRFGVALTHFGFYEQAEYFFRELQKVFPSRETFNNLGYGYLARAMHRLPNPEYWLPQVLDSETLASRLSGRIRSGLASREDARGYLEQAVIHFRRAVDSDTAYLPARINLAAAYYLLGKGYQAQAAIEQARELSPDDVDVLCLRALVLAKLDPELDTAPQAIAQLERLLRRHPDKAMLRFNLATLLGDRHLTARARPHWQWLAARISDLPTRYREPVCEATGRSELCEKISDESDLPAPPFRYSVQPGLDLLADQATQQRFLSGWQAVQAFDWGADRLQGHIYRSQHGRETALEINGYIEMVLLQGDLGSRDRLRACCEAAARKSRWTGGEIWSFGLDWAVWLDGDRIREVWIHAAHEL
jgi:tetratricopeptide (TPR) repeat protein